MNFDQKKVNELEKLKFVPNLHSCTSSDPLFFTSRCMTLELFLKAH